MDGGSEVKPLTEQQIRNVISKKLVTYEKCDRTKKGTILRPECGIYSATQGRPTKLVHGV